VIGDLASIGITDQKLVPVEFERIRIKPIKFIFHQERIPGKLP
jgi:hypothetical protein